MFYYACIETIDETVVYVSSDEKAEKDDLVVYMGDGPSLAVVNKAIDELSALTKYDGRFDEAIKVISMKEYNERLAKEIQKRKLVARMREEMEIAKLEETLRKHSEDTSVMSRLYTEYKSLFGSEE